MQKNTIGLPVLFALLGLGISLLLLGVGGQFILQAKRYVYKESGNFGAGLGFSIAGLACLIFSIALIMRLPWARTAFQVLLILGGIAWIALLLIIAKDSRQAWPLLIGMAAAGLSMALFGVLLLENTHFQRDMHKGEVEDKEQWDILDQ